MAGGIVNHIRGGEALPLREVRDRGAHVQRLVLANATEIPALQGDPLERRV